ncbi:DUF2335 domain-containing protein [Methylobacterium sp. ID0610]|uniref:DUF2335 domain-containing protein n=1 Tax=Methylobacterium carpenticola TaxID=3344827 RepID=UPI00369F427C
MDEFEALVPDAPERIVAPWEPEARHRRVLEEHALRGSLRTVRIGQIGAIAFGSGRARIRLLPCLDGASLRGGRRVRHDDRARGGCLPLSAAQDGEGRAADQPSR